MSRLKMDGRPINDALKKHLELVGESPVTIGKRKRQPCINCRPRNDLPIPKPSLDMSRLT